MANFIYSEGSGLNDAMIGKFVHPIRALIESESDRYEKEPSLVDVLFNVEKSNRYAETTMGESDFDIFKAKAEGAGAENDSVNPTFSKTIEHIEFGKSFTITKKMMDDAKFGIARGISTNMKTKSKNFTRAYYKTREKAVSQALINGINTSMKFAGETVDLTTGDGKALFFNEHPYFDKKRKEKQTNYFYSAQLTTSAAQVERALNVLSNKIRNFKDENGEVLGYTADTIILPGNRPLLEDLIKKVCGSERTTGTNHNDINTQYGNWTIVVMPDWQTDKDEFMVMSSEANESLLGNMFYNRVPLDIRTRIDDDTRNMIFNGYCRFGLGFTTWKHIVRAVNIGSLANATQLTEIESA